MKDYILLDGKKYQAIHQHFGPQIQRFQSAGYWCDGTVDVSGQIISGWTGVLRAPVTPPAGYGSYADLKLTLVKKAPVPFADHSTPDEAAVLAHVLGPFAEQLFDPSGTTFYKVQVRIVPLE